jgi:hypothetical protein
MTRQVAMSQAVPGAGPANGAGASPCSDRRRSVRSLGLLAGVVLTVAGCASSVSRAELVESLERSGIDTPRAECAADAVLDELSDEEVARLLDRGPAGAPRDDPERSDDASDRVRAALAECQQIGAATSEPEPPATEPTAPASNAPDNTATAPLDEGDAGDEGVGGGDDGSGVAGSEEDVAG